MKKENKKIVVEKKNKIISAGEAKKLMLQVKKGSITDMEKALKCNIADLIEHNATYMGQGCCIVNIGKEIEKITPYIPFDTFNYLQLTKLSLSLYDWLVSNGYNVEYSDDGFYVSWW